MKRPSQALVFTVFSHAWAVGNTFSIPQARLISGGATQYLFSSNANDAESSPRAGGDPRKNPPRKSHENLHDSEPCCCRGAFSATKALPYPKGCYEAFPGWPRAGSVCACSGGSNSGSSTAPSTPPLVPTSDMFTGTVPVGGSDAHNFVVNLSNGQVTADLTAAGPPTTIAMGLGIGTVSSGTCTLLPNGYTITTPGPTSQLGGNNFSSVNLLHRGLRCRQSARQRPRIQSRSHTTDRPGPTYTAARRCP